VLGGFRDDNRVFDITCKMGKARNLGRLGRCGSRPMTVEGGTGDDEEWWFGEGECRGVQAIHEQRLVDP
jgi:hypothetical protein